MRRTIGINEIRWQVQDLREQTFLAEAEQVRIERHIRVVVQCPANRMKLPGRIPHYADPADAVDALRRLGNLAYLVQPGIKRRIQPSVLLSQWERAANEAEILRSRLEGLESDLEAAGVRL